MRHLPPMVDMSVTPKDTDKSPETDPSDAPRYPYGLCICLTQDELDKLNLKADDVEIGDTIHLFAFAKVTSKSSTDHEDFGKSSRVELQITQIASEDEDTENEDDDKSEKVPVTRRLYGG